MSLVLTGLSRSYGVQKAVDEVSFAVAPGQITGFLGPNGAGKSTTMKMLTGYLLPTGGRAEVCGFDVVTQSRQVRQRIGYLPEHNPLYPDMYVHEYLHFIGSLHGLRGRQLRERTTEMVEVCGLIPEQRKRIGALSKGYRQRVGLAQSLLHDPPVLILDEPTTGLDPNQIVEIREVIRRVGAEKTVLFSSHLMQEVQAVCNRVLIINRGRLVADSTVAELQNRTEGRTLMVVFGEAVDVEELRALAGVVEVLPAGANSYRLRTGTTDLRAALSRLAAERDWRLLELRQEENSLESIFGELTK